MDGAADGGKHTCKLRRHKHLRQFSVRCARPPTDCIAQQVGEVDRCTHGFTRTPQRRKKISDKKRATAKLNPDAVQAIRAAKKPVKAAQEYGIAKATAIRIRAYESWKTTAAHSLR